MFVELTPRGKALVEQGFREEMALQARLVSGLGDKEQWVLATLLKKLEATMDPAKAVE